MKQFNGWNEAHLRDLKSKGKIRDYSLPQQKKNSQRNKNFKPRKNSKEKSWLAWNLSYWANEHALTMVEEHRFHPARKFRFDYCFPALKIAVEYEGIFSEKSRHTTVSGYTGDTNKYNAAQQLGWRVIRLTALNYETVLQQLNEYVSC